MTKIDAVLRDKILFDKKTMTTKQLQEKYNLSRSSVQRVKLPDLEARVAEFEPPAKPKDEEQAINIVQNIIDEPAPAPAPAPAPKPKGPPREDTIQRILLNADTFPAHYPFIADKSAFIASLTDKSPEQLVDLLKMMEQTRSVNNLSAQMKQVFFVFSRATETLGSRIHLKTQGLTDALLQQQQELDYIFKELAITYADKLSATTRPELKLLAVFGMAVLTTDAHNRIKERLQPQEKYGDL